MWSDEAARSSLHLLADSLRHGTGFDVAVLSVVDDRGRLENVAVAGDEDSRSQLLGRRVPLDLLLLHRRHGATGEGDDLGNTGGDTGGAGRPADPRISFVTAEENTLDPAWGWTALMEPPADPDGWNAFDWLSVTVRSAAGDVVGLIQLDLPVDSLRPGPGRLREIAERCAIVEQAVVAACDRERFAVQARLALTARNVLRSSSGRQGIPAILTRCRDAVMDGFRSRALFIHLLEEPGHPGVGTVYTQDGRELAVPTEVLETSERDARMGWSQQRGTILDEHHALLSEWLSQPEADHLLPFLAGLGVDTLLFVPVGVGATCLGSLTMTREAGDPTWTEAELETALDIGHDLGQAILNARAWRHEQQLLVELRALDAYKSGLIATVSHELRNPLTAVSGHLELLGAMADELPAQGERSLAAMARGTRRLERIIEDLLLLSTVGDPNRTFTPAEVDLRDVVRDVRDLHDLSARSRDQRVVVTVPDVPVRVLGMAEDLDRVVSNLLSNALKYSRDGATVQVALTQDDHEVVVTCSDPGLGIAPEDQAAVFGEFYRSPDPAVRRQHGTGLGLAIVRRIVDRHRGRVDLVSEVGVGSTFRVVLPSLAESLRIEAHEADGFEPEGAWRG